MKREKMGALTVYFTKRQKYQLRSSLQKNNSEMNRHFPNTPFENNYLSFTYEQVIVVFNFEMLTESKSLISSRLVFKFH